MLALYKSYYRNHCIYKEGQAMLVAKLDVENTATAPTQVNFRKCTNCHNMPQSGGPGRRLKTKKGRDKIASPAQQDGGGRDLRRANRVLHHMSALYRFTVTLCASAK